MPNNDAVNASDGCVMDEMDHELEEFKRFRLMTKPLENHPKVAVRAIILKTLLRIGLNHLDPFHVHLDPFHVYLDPFHVYLDPFHVYKSVSILIG